MSANIDSTPNEVNETISCISENPNPSLSDPTLLETTIPIAHKFDFSEPDNESNIIRDGDIVKAATFSKLIELITRPDTDTNFLHDFVLTYRSFATPFDLLEGLTVRLQTANETNKRTISLRILNLFKHWFEKAWYDFEKDCPELYNRTVALFDRIYMDESVKKVVHSVRVILDRKINGEDKSTKKTAAKMLRPILPKDPTCDILDINSEEIARQLTILEWEMWEAIQPWECLSLSWMKKDKDVLAPNVIKMIERFNWVSGWVSSTICTIESLKKRSKVVSKFIDIADKCYLLHNFNGVMEIMSGLNRGPVYRLKQTWENIPGQMKKTFDELKTLTDRAKNYANMRKHLKKVDPPLLPYLGIYLTDLTFIEEGNKNDVGGLINFKKRHQISETIRSIQQYQFKAYAIEKVEFIHDKLRNVTIYDEDTLYELSEYLEPRPGKERGPRPPLLDKEFRKKNDEYNIPIELEDINNVPYSSPDTPSNVVLEDDKIKSGTIEKIIEYLTHHVIVDSNGVFSFFFTYRTFVNPEKVLELLKHRFSVPPPKNKTPQNMDIYKNELLSNIQLRVFFALKTWIDKHYYDFASNQALKDMLIDFINGEMLQATPKYAQTLLESLNKQGHSTITFMNEETPPPVLFSKSNLDIKKASILDFNSEEISRQLCLYHHQKFLNILPYELLNKEVNIGENLRIFLDTIKWFEAWIMEEATKSDKIKVVEKFCEISSYCAKNSNLHASRAITVTIMENIKNGSFDISLDSLPLNIKTELVNNFELYSNSNLLSDKIESLSPPCIPCIEYYLEEIDTIENTCGPDILLDNKINFEKKRKCGETLKAMSELQKMKYVFYEVPIIQSYFLNMESNISNKEISPENSKKILTLMSDYIKNNHEFREEIRNISLDIFNKEAEKLRKDFKLLSSGHIHSKTFLEEKSRIPIISHPFTKKSISENAPKSNPSVDNIVKSPIQKTLSNESINNKGSPSLIKSNSQNSTQKLSNDNISSLNQSNNTSTKQNVSNIPQNTIKSNNNAIQKQVISTTINTNIKESQSFSTSPSQKDMNPLAKANSMPKSPMITRHIEGDSQRNRSSFTAASKQQGIKDLLLSLGKSSGNISFLNPQKTLNNTPQQNDINLVTEQKQDSIQESNPPKSYTSSVDVNQQSDNHSTLIASQKQENIQNPNISTQNKANLLPLNSSSENIQDKEDLVSINRHPNRIQNQENVQKTMIQPKNPNILLKQPSNVKLIQHPPKKEMVPIYDSPKKKNWGPKKIMKMPKVENQIKSENIKLPVKKLPPKFMVKDSAKKISNQSIEKTQGNINKMSIKTPVSNSGNIKVMVPKKKLTKVPPKSNSKIVKLPPGEINIKNPPTPSNIKQENKLTFQEHSINKLKTDFPGCKIEKWEYFDEKGVVYGSPSNISITTFILNNRIYLCSIKESINETDITILIRIGKLYKTIHPSSPLSCLIMTKSISENSMLISEKCKIKVYKL